MYLIFKKLARGEKPVTLEPTHAVDANVIDVRNVQDADVQQTLSGITLNAAAIERIKTASQAAGFNLTTPSVRVNVWKGRPQFQVANQFVLPAGIEC